MIEEDYVSFETAKLLKEKGFDEATIGYYNTLCEIPERIKFFDSPIFIYGSDGLIGCIQAPTLQLAMKWLREVHHITIGITFSLGIINYEIQKDKEFITAIGSSRSYEDMVEEAIKYCLENLI